jgi:hypothetical protein
MYDAFTHTNTRTTHTNKILITHIREEKAYDNNYYPNYYNYNKTLRVALET